MKPKTIMQVIIISIVLLTGTAAFKMQQSSDIFAGIDDEKILPMLKNLPHRHGGMNVPAEDGRFLYDLILEKGYKRGLEIGTSNGYSGLWIGLALRQNKGELVTLEINPQAANEARENFREAGLDGLIQVRTADALEEIPKVPGTFDFIFIDAWKPDYFRYLQLVKDKVVPGGAITAHNVAGSRRQMRDFVYAIKNDPDLETTIYPVSGRGISVSIVRSK